MKIAKCSSPLIYHGIISFRSEHYAYSESDAKVDTLTRFFKFDRSLREAHDPVRFTGVNHIPQWLHADLSSLDIDYSNLLKEREIISACRYSGPGSFYTFRSIRPYNKTYDDSQDAGTSYTKMRAPDVEDARSGLQRGKMSVQALGYGQMPYLE